LDVNETVQSAKRAGNKEMKTKSEKPNERGKYGILWKHRILFESADIYFSASISVVTVSV